MELTHEHKLEILDINLTCLKEEDKNDGCIKVDFETTEMWLDHLEIHERFEDCYLIKENRQNFIEEVLVTQYQ
jgi:hypothetical protein